jgi:hypothetical protein
MRSGQTNLVILLCWWVVIRLAGRTPVDVHGLPWRRPRGVGQRPVRSMRPIVAGWSAEAHELQPAVAAREDQAPALVDGHPPGAVARIADGQGRASRTRLTPLSVTASAPGSGLHARTTRMIRSAGHRQSTRTSRSWGRETYVRRSTGMPSARGGQAPKIGLRCMPMNRWSSICRLEYTGISGMIRSIRRVITSGVSRCPRARRRRALSESSPSSFAGTKRPMERVRVADLEDLHLVH